jgi:hypothetical protein
MQCTTQWLGLGIASNPRLPDAPHNVCHESLKWRGRRAIFCHRPRAINSPVGAAWLREASDPGAGRPGNSGQDSPFTTEHALAVRWISRQKQPIKVRRVQRSRRQKDPPSKFEDLHRRKLDLVAIGIGEIDGHAHAMVLDTANSYTMGNEVGFGSSSSSRSPIFNAM